MPNNKKQSTSQGNKEHPQKAQNTGQQGGYGNTSRQAGSGERGGYVDVSGSQGQITGDEKTSGKRSGMNKDDEDEM